MCVSFYVLCGKLSLTTQCVRISLRLLKSACSSLSVHLALVSSAFLVLCFLLKVANCHVCLYEAYAKKEECP